MQMLVSEILPLHMSVILISAFHCVQTFEDSLLYKIDFDLNNPYLGQLNIALVRAKPVKNYFFSHPSKGLLSNLLYNVLYTNYTLKIPAKSMLLEVKHTNTDCRHF